ncbi:MAG: phage holin family protein [Kofleriaceae bacterium]|nr:phage holin family protein [Myxococcales bacterium]MCB9565462.1 phage holin family protein [Kofleriaceae bacterium]MCB9573200.1 phage holin family protein [Kofleriaceae bacterium]
MTWTLVKIAIRLVAFTGVFWLATRPRKGNVKGKDGKDSKPARVKIQPRWAIPLVGVLFAALNIALYWLVRPVLDIATLRSLSLAMPLVVNGLLLWGTARIVEKKQWLEVDGFFAGLWLAGALTIAHGTLWVALDYLPVKL